jgi:hypothetical protein
MTRLTPFAVLMLVAMSAGFAAAQTATPPGSITVLSRPPHAAFKLIGDQTIMGRTPMTLERGLNGHYRIESNQPGFGHWDRTIDLSGAIADTVWMTLTRKSAGGAFARSLFIPGWGQAYSERPLVAAAWLVAAAGAGTMVAICSIQYRNRQDDVNAATVTSRPGALQQLDDAQQLKNIALGAAGAVWGLNLIDAVLNFPSLPAGMSLELSGAPAGRGASARAVLTTRF